MGHLSPPEHQRNLDFVSGCQEIFGMFDLEIEVVFPCKGPEFDLFELGSFLMEFGRVFFFTLLIFVFSKIQNSADGRNGGGGDLDQV